MPMILTTILETNLQMPTSSLWHSLLKRSSKRQMEIGFDMDFGVRSWKITSQAVDSQLSSSGNTIKGRKSH